jgi:plasmid segregation protein ParM
MSKKGEIHMYKFRIANDNGNSAHKIMIDDTVYNYPNVYSIIYEPQGQSDEPLKTLVDNLHNNLDVIIDSTALPGDPKHYLVGRAALATQSATDIYNMEIQYVNKHEENLPVVNTLAIIATEAVKRHFYENKKENLVNGETIDVEIEMTTALPASIHDSKTDEQFRSKFMNHLHQVRVNIKNLVINVKINFKFVKVLKEGIPALFAIIEDGNENYRSDEMFDKFKKEYKYEGLDGSDFLDKSLLHVDIGDGSTELVFTQGYTADPLKSYGEKYGLGRAIEKACQGLSQQLSIDFTRQQFSEYLKDKKHKFHKKALNELYLPKQEVADKVFASIKNRLQTLKYEVDCVVVYGGASILLEDVLYKQLVEFCRTYDIDVLWIPEKFADSMNMLGMKIYNDIQMNELIAAAGKK